MNNLDEQLQRLIVQLLQSRSNSSEYNQEMNRLLAMIPRLPGLRQDPHPDYLEAVNQTLRTVQQKFSDFQRYARNKQVTLDSVVQVRQCFVRWVNQFLRLDILDLYRKGEQPLSLDAPIDGGEEKTIFIEMLSNEGFKPPTWDGLEIFIQRCDQDQIRRKGEALERYIETDPDGLLQNCYCKKNPDSNCQNIAKLIYLANRGGEITLKQGQQRIVVEPAETNVTLRAFANSLGLSEQTITSHWKRKCREILLSFLQTFEQQKDS